MGEDGKRDSFLIRLIEHLIYYFTTKSSDPQLYDDSFVVKCRVAAMTVDPGTARGFKVPEPLPSGKSEYHLQLALPIHGSSVSKAPILQMQATV